MNSFVFYILLLNSLDFVGILSAKIWHITKNPLYFTATILIFSGVGFCFTRALRYEGMAITNVLWTALSIILSTIFGYFIFKEEIAPIQFVGIFVVIVGLVLINWR